MRSFPREVLTVVLGFFGLVLIALGSLAYLLSAWRTVYVSHSPDGKNQVWLQESNCVFDCAVRVILKQGWRRTEIATGNDCHVSFAHAAWKGSVVSVYFDGDFCGEKFAAFDTATQKAVEFGPTREWLSLSIINSYSVTRDELARYKRDVMPLPWLAYREGMPRPKSEFARRYRVR